MGERDTAWQKPGYDGLCNYAQKITSCFGLDGKTGGEADEVERGVFLLLWSRDGGGWENVWEAFVCGAVFISMQGQQSCFLSMYVLIFECVGSCVKATTEWMTIGGQRLTAAE